MNLEKQPLTIPWFKLALTSILVFSLVLRFWRIEQFNTLVFDEVYYPVFANRYLIGEPVYNAHPPLSQLIIAVGMWLGSHLPFGQDVTNSLTGSIRSTFSYRWLNALTGSFIPVVMGAIAYQITLQRSYGLLVALFAALDGLFLVESRYGLNNVYLVLFGLLGHLFCLLALHSPPQSRRRPSPRRFRHYQRGRFRWIRRISDRVSVAWSERRPLTRRQHLALSGVFCGLSAAIKWNGLAFLLGLYLIWFLAWLLRWSRGRAEQNYSLYSSHSLPLNGATPLQNLTQLNLLHILFYWLLIPAVTYALTWIPHLIMNPQPGFWEMHSKILRFHQEVGSGPDIHPYCSPWYSWPFMWRPVAYFYYTTQNPEEMIPAYPPLPPGIGSIIYDVHAMGNPFLWWFSSAAILLLILVVIQQCWSGKIRKSSLSLPMGLVLYGVVNYCANLLPWMKVSRCVFIYHYMGASVFATFALAWMIDNWLHHPRPLYRYLGLGAIALVIIAFYFWLPLYLGLPLSKEGYQIRMWFRNWI
ncbi:dolichyl-phosphate-mannose--protein mannosyltransferase [Spirulina subsalsa]|uniref:dolichyl-phosphate-mannose--protein mannosyltransferase n=1 Tax=Spirulina subsalsa TaxID=54311 RepID=UPI0002EEA6D6|nr:phospholipid carrier-dependent glycosyltransferase [Spirulina subsalsa]